MYLHEAERYFQSGKLILKCIEEMKNQEKELISRLGRKWEKKDFIAQRLGGQTNRNFVVAYKNKKFFVRLPWERGDIIDRKIEGKNILALTKNRKLAEILPKYHTYILNKRNILARSSKDFFDVPDGTMVAEYIEGKEFTHILFQKKESIITTAIARAI